MRELGPPPPEVIATFGTSYAVSCAFFTDPEGRALIVRAHHRDHWQFVGGMVDKGESPHEACEREIQEEIGLPLPVTDLLVFDWVQAHGFVSAPMAVYVFDGGVIDSPERIRLQADELVEFAFLPPDEAETRFQEDHRRRIPLAVEARRTGRAVYQPLLRDGAAETTVLRE